VFAVVSCRVREFAIGLKLIVVRSFKSRVNAISFPNPVPSHLSRDTMNTYEDAAMY
jgi:hypothetical protein